MPVKEIPAMRRRIDAATEAAGRRPDQIRSILNLSIRIDPDARLQPKAACRQAVGRRKRRLRATLGGGY